MMQKEGPIKHGGLCLDAEGLKGMYTAVLRPCEEGKATQQWVFEKYFT